MLSSHILLIHHLKLSTLNLSRFSYNFATMTELTQAMELLRNVFDKYSGKEGDKDTLSKKELTRLIYGELPFHLVPRRRAEFEQFVKELDADSDGLVTFQEYVNFVTELTVKYCSE